jgi:holo-[acyl-carrier protein] synthase
MAIVGLGTDIVEIARMEKQLEKSTRLAERILTPVELSLFQQSKFPARYLAKRFAAKEAMVKAVGTGIGNGVGWQQMTVLNHDNGQPYLEYSGFLAETCEKMHIKHCFLTIADEIHYAIATVILEA